MTGVSEPSVCGPVPITRSGNLCDLASVEMIPGEPFFENWVDPTAAELRSWAYANAYEPNQDFEVMLDGSEVLPVVVECAEDPGCPTKDFMLASLYCTVGHLQEEDRLRVREVANRACHSDDPAVRTWGKRAVAVIDEPARMSRWDWCGDESLAYTNPIEG